MADAPEKTNPTGRKRGPFFEWLDRRTGIDSLLHEALDEPIPGGARWAYVFGSVLLFLFISPTSRGVFLSRYYVPEPDAAHVRVVALVMVVPGGTFLGRCHHRVAVAVAVVYVHYVE